MNMNVDFNAIREIRENILIIFSRKGSRIETFFQVHGHNTIMKIGCVQKTLLANERAPCP